MVSSRPDGPVDESKEDESTAADPAPDVWVAGADGYRDGWYVVFHRPRTGRVVRRQVTSFVDLLEAPEAPEYIGIDMVIGLPDQAESGGRPCDRMARALLGHPRSSSVFSPPAQSALPATTYDEARALHTGTAEDAPGITIQAFHLFPKLREIDAVMTPDRQDQVREVHPEMAFYAMNGDEAVQESKHTSEGRRLRAHLLAEHGFVDLDRVLQEDAGRGVGADDILDAHAVCWSARRMLEDRAQCLPPSDEPASVNDRGLRMEIWR